MDRLALSGRAVEGNLMRWPFTSRAEKRQSGGGYTDAVVAAIEAQASAKVADASSTAAIEAAAGALSRAFMGCEVDAPSWVQEAVTPTWLAQVGRSPDPRGREPVCDGHGRRRHGRARPGRFLEFRESRPRDDGRRARKLMASAGEHLWPKHVLHPALASRPARFRAVGNISGNAVSRARSDVPGRTQRRGSKAKPSDRLPTKPAGPLAQLLTTPEGTDTDSEDDSDPWSAVRVALAGARGGSVLLETVSTGGGDGPAAAPRRDWEPRRLGPSPPDAMVAVAQAAFSRMLAACGVPPALYDPAAPATALKEGTRLWHMGTVVPLARLIEHELSMRLDARVRLRFDSYAKDQMSRSTVFAKLMGAEGMTVDKALAIAGLLEGE